MTGMLKKLITVMITGMLASAVPAVSMAQETETAGTIWPEKAPVVYIGYSAESGTDYAVRPVIEQMSKYLGETIECQNMEGRNSADAANYVLSLPHDGYSMVATGSGGCSSWGVKGYSESTWKDWLSFHAFSGPAVLFVNSESGITTMDELLAYVSAGGVFGIGEYGNGPHTQFEAIRTAAGLETPAYQSFGSCRNTAAACLAGDISCGIGSLSAAISLLGEEKLTAIAVTSREPYELPDHTVIPSVSALVDGTDDVPLLNETWPIMIPRDTPQQITDALTEAFRYALETTEITGYAASMGYQIIGYTCEEADRFMSYTLSAYAWTIYRAGEADISPEKLQIPEPEAYNWDEIKQNLAEEQSEE